MSALEEMAASIERALDECVTSEVLSVLTGAFVGVTLAVAKAHGCDTNTAFLIDGGESRDITIHAPKGETA